MNIKDNQRKEGNRMVNITLIKSSIAGCIGAIGSFIAQSLGGWTSDMQTLIILMGIDIVMGLLIAALWNKSNKSSTGRVSSSSMAKGLVRKGVYLLIILVAYRLDKSLNTDYIRTAAIIAFIVNELISIVENAGIMGIPMPGVIIKAIDVLKKKEE